MADHYSSPPLRQPLTASRLEERAAGPLVDFLHSTKKRAAEIMAVHGLSNETAEIVLGETLRMLVWRWETIRNREAWLFAVLERKCQAAAIDLEGNRP